MAIMKHSLANTPALVPLVFAFLTCGVLYLAFPDQHYVIGWATMVKYFILTLGVLLAAAVARAPRKLQTIHFLIVGWGCSIAIGVALGAPLSRGLLYCIPVIAFALPRETRSYLPILSVATLAFALVGSVYEAAAFGGFAMFADYGYRASSIFINPNNLAITAVVLLSFTLKLKSVLYNGIAVASATVLVVTSGSKAGMVLFAILLVYVAARRNIKLAAVVAVCLAGLAALALVLGWLRAPILSVYLRIEQIVDFATNLGNPLFPSVDRDVAAPLYVDNVYLQTWNEMGAPAAIVLVCILLHLALRDRLSNPGWLLFGAAGLSENFIYLWPLAYLFWAYAGERPSDTIPKTRDDAAAVIEPIRAKP